MSQTNFVRLAYQLKGVPHTESSDVLNSNDGLGLELRHGAAMLSQIKQQE